MGVNKHEQILQDMMIREEEFMKEFIERNRTSDNLIPAVTFLNKHGQFYKPQELPRYISKMKDKECYSNAYYLADEFCDEFTYCEGYALSSRTGAMFEHAWVIDENDNVIDATWKDAGLAYYGIAITIDYLWEAIVKTERLGIICEYKLYPRLELGEIPDSAFAR